MNLRKFILKKPIKKYHMVAFGGFVSYVLIFIVIMLFMRYDGHVDP